MLMEKYKQKCDYCCKKDFCQWKYCHYYGCMNFMEDFINTPFPQIKDWKKYLTGVPFNILNSDENDKNNNK